MKLLRKWSRIIHRDLGYFLIGTSLIYAISGIALNHLNDWNPSYSVKQTNFSTEIDLQKSEAVKQNVIKFLDEIKVNKDYKSHYYPEPDIIKVFLEGGSSVIVDTKTGMGTTEILRKRALFYDVNFLHYNPSYWWMWFSDIYAGGLIIIALSSFFMVRGRKGAWGRGGIYIAFGFLIPILFLIFL